MMVRRFHDTPVSDYEHDAVDAPLMTYRELGKLLGVHKGRVQQIHDRAVVKLWRAARRELRSLLENVA